MAADGPNLKILRQNQRPISSSSSSQPVDRFFLSGSSNSSLLGSSSMVSFEDVHAGKRSSRLFFSPIDQEDIGDEDFDEYLNHPGKKRRLTSDQVRFLERSFEVENKLEPERKVQLARDLNLQPRQVAIWFQNRRARWKSKQLEKDYDVLQSQFDSLKANYDNLVREKENLKAEVELLSDKLNLTEKEKGSPKFSDATDASQGSPPEPIVESFSETSPPKVFTVSCNQEHQSSAKTDVFESESANYTEMGHSSYIFKHDYHSDISQDEEDNLTMSLLPPLKIFPKLEVDDDLIDLPANSCNLGGLPVEDHAIWSWCF